jgi:CBS domain-containing protein
MLTEILTMATAGDLVSVKGGSVATLPGDATVLQAAQVMNERHIGSIVVMEGDRLSGIFTERDILRRIVAAKRDPARTPISEVMTYPVACATRQTTLNELRQVMRDKRIRHVPLVDDRDRVIGMISIGDLNKAEHQVQEQTILYLAQYMSVL